jgi:Ser/Thr protein kinase RdoA (MazF antagonist)
LEHLLEQPLQSIRPLLARRRDDWEYLVTLAEKLRLHMYALPLESLETGFCHGDLHGGNAHRDRAQTLTFFGFDACGMGWRVYDIAVFRWSAPVTSTESVFVPGGGLVITAFAGLAAVYM